MIVEFSDTDTVVVTHGMDCIGVGVRVSIDGQIRNSLIDTVVYGAADPRNELTVTLTSAQSGVVQVMCPSWVQP